MYDSYEIPCELQWDTFKIMITSAGGNSYHYLREGAGGTVEKQLISNRRKLIISPVEPLSTPKFLTPYLLIEFSHPVLIAPKLEQTIFLTFPLDLGIHLSSRSDFELIDVCTLTSPKYTLYGDPSNGILCKYWKSKVYDVPPEIDQFQEAVLQLQISNQDNEWMEVRQVVLNAFGMMIFHEDGLVQSRALMELRAGAIAETEFKDTPPRTGMKKSIEIFQVKKLSMASKKFLMEHGL